MKKIILLSMLAVSLITVSCKKKSSETTKKDERVPPSMSFKTGTAYTSGDITTTKQDTILVGVMTTKTEDDLSSFNASVAYDGSSTTTTFFNHTLNSNEYGGYSVDVPYIVRNQSGSEVLTFSIVDRDGNITMKTITITVP